jgi:hypothetical protein
VDPAAAAAWLQAQELDAEAPADGAERPDLSRPCEVWAENWTAVMLLLQLQTQWHWTEDNRQPRALDYPALQAALWARGVGKRDRAALWDALVDMQHDVLEAWHEL